MTSLVKQVDNWVKSFNTAGTRGLVVMTDVVNHIAEHRDTDAALRLLSKVDDNTRRAFANIIRARFGNDADGKPLIKAKKDVSHSSGWKIVLPKELPALSNETSVTWGYVQDALAEKKSFTNAELHKKLRTVWKEEVPSKPFDYKAVAKRLLKAIDEKEANAFALIEEMKRQIKASAATETAVVETTNNVVDIDTAAA